MRFCSNQSPMLDSKSVHWRRSDSGFWLSEVLISLWIVAFVAAGILGVFVYLAKTSKISNERAAGELLAERVLDQATAVGPPLWGLPIGQLNQIQKLPRDANDSLLSYRLSVRTLREHRLGTLFDLEVIVWWTTEPGVVTGVERGKGELRLQRSIYVEDLEEEVPGGG